MTQPGDEPPAYLDGESAIAWFMRTKGGPEIYDRHVAAISELFGVEAIRSVRAVTHPRNGTPQTLIVEVAQAGVTEDESWILMLRVQERLVEQEEQLRDRFRINPFGRIVLTLASTAEDWDEFVRRIEEEP